MKHIALLSPSSGGHHDTYLRIYISSLLRLGHRVTAFTSHPAEIDAWANATSMINQERVQTVAVIYDTPRPALGPFSTLAGKYHWVKAMSAAVQRSGIQPDLLFHMWLDNCLTPGLTSQLTDRIVPYRWSGLYFHPWHLRKPLAFQSLRRGFLASHAALRSSRCPAVAVLDEGIAPALQQHLKGKPVIVFPDIADDTAPDHAYPPAQEILQRAQGRTVICLLGALSRRKGLLTMVDMVHRMNVDDFFFVFAGKLDMNSFSTEAQSFIRNFVVSKPENCLFLFERIPDEAQFNALVTACDVLFAVYDSFLSSSNLLTKAAIFERPILVSEGYCMGERMARYRIGRSVPENDADACIAAVREIAALVHQHGSLPDADYTGYRAIHSISQLEEKLGELLTLG